MNFVHIGYTQKPHGIKGEIKVKVMENHLEDFLSAETVFLEVRGKKVPYFLENVRGQLEFIAKFEGIDQRESVKVISSKELYLRDIDILPDSERTLPKDSGAYGHIAGFWAVDAHAGPLGSVREVQQWPGQQMAVVEYKGKEVLLPLTAAFVRTLDDGGKTITFDLPEGLLEL